MKKFLLLLGLFCFMTNIYSQTDTTNSSTKKGWKFGIALPAIAYDSDIGFKYGALTYFYDYGDGTVYPNYLRSLYAEWSRTTKGSGINTIIYDDKKFFGTKIRYIGSVNYYIEQALDFYGFNGFEAEYNHQYELDSSRMYYRMDRRLWKIISDFQYPIYEDNLKAFAGVSFYAFDINSVDIEKLNEGKDDADKLPSVDSIPGIYENYVANEIIPQNQKNGGNLPHLKIGLIWDTRDLEACPTKGIWTEALIIYAPSIFGNKYSYSQFNITHRQYFNVYKKRILFAYRLSYNSKLSGEMPFYALPFYQNTLEVRDGFGGSKTIRGVLRDRVVGDGVTFGNTELRCKVIDTRLGKIDFYIALSGFFDFGFVTKKYQFTPSSGHQYLPFKDESMHIGYGVGIRFGINTNSIVAVDYGRALNPEDGISGLYINLGWLF